MHEDVATSALQMLQMYMTQQKVLCECCRFVKRSKECCTSARDMWEAHPQKRSMAPSSTAVFLAEHAVTGAKQQMHKRPSSAVKAC